MGINEYLKIGDQIKRLRKLQGYSQKDFAKKLDIPISTYSNYENNNREPSMEIINKIAEALDTTVEDMLGFSSSEISELEASAIFDEYLQKLGYGFIFVSPEDDTSRLEKSLIFIGEDGKPGRKVYELSDKDAEELLNISFTVSEFIRYKIEEIVSRSRKIVN